MFLMAEEGGAEKFDLGDRRVAILATDGFEQVELTEPLEALREAGATVDIVSIASTPDSIRGWNEGEWGERIDVDRTVTDALPKDYHALVLPGGVMNPDRLRQDEDAVEFVRSFFRTGKPVAAICHGPWLLIEAGVVAGREVTSWPSVRTDLENAGAVWVDDVVVVDSGLVTSRGPDDLPAFTRKMLEEISEGRHAGQAA